jgi:hypothetical protein
MIGAFVSGGLIAGVALIVTFLLSVGAERQRVLMHLETTEPMVAIAQSHFGDTSQHLSETENSLLSVLPVKFVQVETRLQSIEQDLKEMNKKLDEALRRR